MDFDARIDAVLRRMAADGIDLLVACSNGLQMPDRPDPVVHLSGYRSLGESFVLLQRDGASKLIISPAADAERAEAWKARHECIATDDLVGTLSREFSNCKTAAGGVTLARRENPCNRYSARVASRLHFIWKKSVLRLKT